MDTHTLHNVHRYRWIHIHYTMYTGIDGYTYTTQCTQDRWTHIHYTMYTGIDGHTYTTQCTQV